MTTDTRCPETRERAVRGQADPIIDQCRLEAAHEGACDYGSPKEPLVGASPLEWRPEPEEEPEVDTSTWLWCAVAVCGCIDLTYEGPQDHEVALALSARGYRLEKRPPEDAVIVPCPHRLT